MIEQNGYLLSLKIHQQLNGEDSDVEEVDFKLPPSVKSRRAPVKRSNPYSNLDTEYLNRTQNLVHPDWENLNPTTDIHALFAAFNTKFFQGRLQCVTLEWSKRMYSCAGICYSRSNLFGMDVTIRLSEPLLKLRTRKDLVETMLHEMIHAYCFVLKIREGNGGHGPYFRKIMYAINKVAGTNITVYHTFHDEVDLYKQQWWRCDGSCQNRSPFFGYVMRTSNGAPSFNDQWWASHRKSCGGTFMKIKGPEKDPKEKSAKGDYKRRRISSSSDRVTDVSWFFVDDDIMMRKKPDKVFTISSDLEEDASDNEDSIATVERPPTVRLTADERQNALKKEILEESLTDDNIVLIDDDYNDDEGLLNALAAIELADTSLVDDLFGEYILLKQFEEANDMVPSGSRHVPNPLNDIITCPICQGKMKRCVFAEHLNGCTGIAVKIVPPKHALKKLSTISKHLKPTRKSKVPHT